MVKEGAQPEELMAALDLFVRTLKRIVPGPAKADLPQRVLGANGVVVLPSPLRDEEDLGAIVRSVQQACATPSQEPRVLVVSVDGTADARELYKELCLWVAGLDLPEGVHVYVTGTEMRLGPVTAVAAGIAMLDKLVEMGVWAEVPWTPSARRKARRPSALARAPKPIVLTPAAAPVPATPALPTPAVAPVAMATLVPPTLRSPNLRTSKAPAAAAPCPSVASLADSLRPGASPSAMAC